MMGAGIVGCALTGRAEAPRGRLLFGVCTAPDHAGTLKQIGYDYIEGSVAACLKPETPDEAFAPELKKLRDCELPVRAMNGFIPGTLRLTGPDAAHDAALDYAVKACARADAAGVSFIVLGSGGARRMPAGFDPAKGKLQFIDFCRKLGERIRDCRVTVVLEPLHRGETNLLNSVAEGMETVDAIQHPRIQLLADVFHMMKDGEGPDSIRKAGARLRHCHIAEKDGRKAPGTKGEDLSAYFAALKDIGYDGGVSCECGWPKTGIEEAWKKALDTMRAQAGV